METSGVYATSVRVVFPLAMAALGCSSSADGTGAVGAAGLGGEGGSVGGSDGGYAGEVSDGGDGGVGGVGGAEYSECAKDPPETVSDDCSYYLSHEPEDPATCNYPPHVYRCWGGRPPIDGCRVLFTTAPDHVQPVWCPELRCVPESSAVDDCPGLDPWHCPTVVDSDGTLVEVITTGLPPACVMVQDGHADRWCCS